jgi:TatD DNase family protein
MRICGFRGGKCAFFLTLNGCPNSKIGPLSIFTKIQDGGLKFDVFLEFFTFCNPFFIQKQPILMLSNAAFTSDNPPFIDIHTHRRTTASGVISVPNFSQKDHENSVYTEGSSFASVGLHPWFLTKENFEKDFEKLSQLVHNQNIIAIGECGLDKLKGEDLAFQTTAFEAQIRLAESVSKPVVIHCVRAFGEIIAIKKRLKPTVPMIIHGFNKNEKVLAELLKHGFYISIGAAILPKNGLYTEGSRNNRENSPFSEILPKIPIDRLFFETDDAENVDISTIYEAAARTLKMDLKNLKSIVYKNLLDITSMKMGTQIGQIKPIHTDFFSL